MAAAHASNGTEAAWPTTGTIFSVAEATRQGNAPTAQPSSGRTRQASATARVARAIHEGKRERERWRAGNASRQSKAIMLWC